MARKTNNSSGGLADFATDTFADDAVLKKRGHHTRSSITTRGRITKVRKRRSIKKASALKSSSDEDDVHRSEDEEQEESEGEGAQPAVIAPSARITNANVEQAGRSSHEEEDEMAGRGRRRTRRQDHQAARHRASPLKDHHNDDDQSAKEEEDDDDYTGVALISDSEEMGEPALEKAEERNIIETVRAHQENPTTTTKSNLHEADAGWECFDVIDGGLLGEATFFDEQFARTDPDLPSVMMDVGSSTSVFEGFSPPPTNFPSPRRVRFITPIPPTSKHSSSIPNDDDDDALSNDGGDISILFEQQDPSSRNANKGSAIDIDEDDEDFDDGSSCGSSSGYETDYGETTDEEDVPINALTKPHAILHRPSPSLDSSMRHAPGPVPSPFKVPSLPPSLRRGPRMGTFITDPSKPIAVVDRTGESLVIFPAKKPAPIKTSLARIPSGNRSSGPATPITPHATLATAPDMSDTEYSEMASQISADPVLSNGPNFAGAAFPQTPARPPPAASQPAPVSVFRPMDSIEDPANYLIEEDDYDDDEAEDQLKIEDFIDWGNSSSDEEGEDASMTEDSKANQMFSKASPSSVSSAQDYFRNFDTGIITAFRREQPHAHDSQRRPQHGLSLSMSAMKTGRNATSAAFPLPQSKKRKLSNSFSPGVPLDMAAKRRLINHR